MSGSISVGKHKPQRGAYPLLVIVLHDNREYRAELTHSEKHPNTHYTTELNANSDFQRPLVCTREDIKEVYLEAAPNRYYRWYIASIDTYTAGLNKI